MAEPTLYHLLGIGANASSAEIKVARRAMLMAHHPDRAEITGVDPGRLAARTRAVIDACNLLFDHGRRAAYDTQIGVARSRRLRRIELAAIDWRADLAQRRAEGAEAQAPPAARHQAGVHVEMPKSSPALSALWRAAYETRLGQWGLVVAAAGATALVAGLVGGPTRPPVEAAAVVLSALALSRGGTPTPLYDAESMAMSAARAAVRAARSLSKTR